MTFIAPPSTAAGLAGQVAVVTGAAQGIGAAAACELAARGASVVIVDRRVADATVAQIERLGGQARAIGADVADQSAVACAFADTLREFGRIDVLVAAAGIMPRGAVDSDFGQWRRVMDVNLDGAFHCVSAVWPAMLKAGRGKIVLVSSIAAFTGGTIAGSEYIVSKAGLVGLARHVARNGASRGIYCNVVAPGVIETDMNKDLPKPPAASIPLRRLGHPKDVAGPIAFLCSAASNYLTGIVVHVNGGAWFAP